MNPDTNPWCACGNRLSACGGALCASCWDEIGHCGHADADQANRVSAAMTPEERREMAQAIAGRDEGEEGA